MKAVEKKITRILILSAPVGSGHKMASQALAEAFSAMPDTLVTQGDVFTFFPAFLGKSFLTCYKAILRFCPGLYALSYRWGNAGSGSLFLRNLINRVFLRCGKNYLADVAPDVVLSTHGTPTGILSLYKKKYAPQLRIGVVVTDYTVHRWLVYPEVDVYFIAEQALEGQVAKALSTQETGPSVSRAFGIPVREMLLPFCVAVGRQEARREICRGFGWPEDVFIVLISGGGEGLLPMEEIISLLAAESHTKLRLIAITGHNTLLREQLQEGRYGTNSRLEILGFTEELPKLIGAADLMIGKGGGISIAECLALGTPLLIYSPLPGQEQKNTEFLVQNQGAGVASTVEEIAAAVRKEMAKTPAERERERESLRRRLGHPEAAKKIAGFTKSLTI